MREIGHFIGGKAVKGGSGRFGDVFDPNTGEIQAKVTLARHSEVEHAIANAQAAQPGWAATNPQRRARVMFKFLDLVQKEFDTWPNSCPPSTERRFPTHAATFNVALKWWSSPAGFPIC